MFPPQRTPNTPQTVLDRAVNPQRLAAGVASAVAPLRAAAVLGAKPKVGIGRAATPKPKAAATPKIGSKISSGKGI